MDHNICNFNPSSPNYHLETLASGFEQGYRYDQIGMHTRTFQLKGKSPERGSWPVHGIP